MADQVTLRLDDGETITALERREVVIGELTFVVGPGAERVTVEPGAFVAVPPNVVHTFSNDSGAEASWLNLHAPDTGFAAFLRAAREGRESAWDSFDAPADGGLPAAGVIVSGPVLPQPGVLEIRAPD